MPPAQRGRRIVLEDLVEPISANRNLQTLALDQVRFPKPLPLRLLMAYSDDGGAVLDLTRSIAADGSLDWVAPVRGTPPLPAAIR